MLIMIDAGNSTVAFGIFEGENLAVSFKAETRKAATSDEYWSFLVAQMDRAGVGASEVEGIAVSAVVPYLVPVLFEAMKGITDKTPLLVSHRLKTTVKMGYKSPETLGPDRLAAVTAAYEIQGGPVAVVDFGTATTFSVVDGQGSFLGGAIAPGLMTGYDALTDKAPGLPRAGFTFPKNALGRSTGEGLMSGVIFGHAAMVDGMLERFKTETGENLTTVVTGGLSRVVAPHMKGKPKSDPHLVLKGLAAIYRMNS